MAPRAGEEVKVSVAESLAILLVNRGGGWRGYSNLNRPQASAIHSDLTKLKFFHFETRGLAGVYILTYTQNIRVFFTA